MDEYGNWIYLTPMVLGGVASVLAAAWKFLGIGQPVQQGPLDSLYALGPRIRKADSEAELSDIEEEIDSILATQRARSASGDENAVDDATLNVAAHRLEGLIHDRPGTACYETCNSVRGLGAAIRRSLWIALPSDWVAPLGQMEVRR